MNKSFVSKVEALKTNWKEVGRDKVEIQFPDGTEQKNRNHEPLVLNIK